MREFSKVFGTKPSLFGSEQNGQAAMAGFLENHVLLVAEKGNEMVGCMAGVITPHIYNPAIIVLYEAIWWVVPAHRGSRAGLMMLDEFVRIGRAIGVDWVMFSVAWNTPVRDRFLLRRGFKMQETCYRLEV